ncbi:PfkB family carbohydrate kinase [Pseudobacteroides cellulosolvens]|uniref:Fructokinase n=1 Tax=Pseudobacteroides cellulosolvens ATCC 35603 = DSM 2933 TaxID=398512 RepID=A0A0L6JM40_9FIRM|nr:PfkB family carbohydrate kinase [Pseudobacteroides cellulosolvens]KNY26866.1 Fructokinase [Pseudobacteroides cellulosolvens ATCC 35603 = DSM 2933]
MFDVTALGELLIDFTPAGLSEQGNICFERNPGGAPANVLACISRLGGKTAFIGKVGKDMFGDYLAETLKGYGIDVSGLMFSGDANTTLAFVQLNEAGDRSFSFYRNPGADTTLDKNELSYELIENSKVFHFGSLSLTDEPARSATIAALEYAREKGVIISYDPNLRPALWKSMEHALQEIGFGLEFCRLLKISEEELEFITGMGDLHNGSLELYKEYGIDVILVTRGSNGCFYRLKDETGQVDTFTRCKTVDTTGAGDAFLGGFLYSLLNEHDGQLQNLNAEALHNMLVFSNAVASLSTTKKGAIPSMPKIDEVQALISGGK